MEVSSNFSSGSLQAYRHVESRYRNLAQILSDHPSSKVSKNAMQIRSAVDDFVKEMEILGDRHKTRGRSLDSHLHKKLEFIAKRFDEVNYIGRASGQDLFSLERRMDKIFKTFNFNAIRP